jgi:aspartate ammonia-lyase
MGATAIGTGLNAPPLRRKVHEHLAAITASPSACRDLIEATQDTQASSSTRRA